MDWSGAPAAHFTAIGHLDTPLVVHFEPLAISDVSALARRLQSREGFVWLDSQDSQHREGRYAFLAVDPIDRVSATFGDKDPLRVLAKCETKAPSGRSSTPIPARAVPKWIGYIAYDAAWCGLIPGGRRHERPARPVLVFQRYPALVVVDRVTDQAWVAGDDRDACLELLDKVDNATEIEWPFRVASLEVDPPERHLAAIERAQAHIAAGDIYQVNLARRWQAQLEGAPIALWNRMRAASHVPLGAFIDCGDHEVLACTMERFLHWDHASRRLVTRPIKGTLRRDEGETGAEAALLDDPKERAEHVMIVDLMRNDLGRVAEIGSVDVEEPLVVEPFTGLYHLVSTVSCHTRDGVGLQDIVRATFPPGSVTGAPKIRAVQLIEELEAHPREVYCGAVGFVDRAGGLSLAVAIRTATVRDGVVNYWAGGGIVSASDPAREVAETELKARVFLEAIA